MAVVIRLRREGTKNRPYYRVVVADKVRARDGKFLEQIGIYDPVRDSTGCKLDLGRVDHWIQNGAKPSDTVASLIKAARKAAPAAA